MPEMRWIYGLLGTGILVLLVRMTRQLDRLQDDGDMLMTKIDDVNKLVADINTVTNTIAGKVAEQEATIQALKDQIAGGSPVTDTQLDDLAANLTSVKEHLESLGQDPNNPVPAEPPVDSGGGTTGAGSTDAGTSASRIKS